MVKYKVIELNCDGRKLSLAEPVVMGILNITPDSFFDGGEHITLTGQLKQVGKMLNEGAAVIDIGAISTRPGADLPSEKEERDRLLPCLTALRSHFPEAILSVDTFRTSIAEAAIDHGASMINDICGGRFDGQMFSLVAGKNIPYILMHMQGMPDTMQLRPRYTDVVREVKDFFRERLALIPSGFKQVILDPGFGFGKTVEHNYQLLRHLDSFHEFGYPLLAGMSRKSMITRVLQIQPSEALNGTTVLNTVALLKGARILRVHDVKKAVEAVSIVHSLGDDA